VGAKKAEKKRRRKGRSSIRHLENETDPNQALHVTGQLRLQLSIEWVDACLLEVDGYRGRAAEAVDRVKSLLGEMHSDRAHRTRKVGNTFVAKVKEAFAALNRPVDWETFYNHDLSLVTALDEDVKEIAVREKLNKSQAKAIQKLKKGALEAFVKVQETGKLSVQA
jgi:hypothetical protein